MTEVRKRLGHTEAFDPNKIRISIQKAVLDAGYTSDEKKELIDEVSIAIIKIQRAEGKDSKSIRNSILFKIEKLQPPIAQSWRRFDEKYKYKR